MENTNTVTDQDTENLDAEITALTESFIEQHYLNNDEAENLEMIVAKSMVLGELYERKKWQTKATPEGFVLIADNSKTVVAIEKMVEQQVEASGITQDVFRLDGHRILEAMIEAQEQSHD